MVNVQSFGDKHPGRRRKNNEDFVAWFEPIQPAEREASGSLYILADGVGGAAKGERASQYATQKVLHEYYQLPDIEPGERLRRLMSQASDDIFTHAEERGLVRHMATTMVAAVVRFNKLILANVGDSRAYLLRGGVATQLTRDHSIVGEMMANGDMTEEEARNSDIKNRLTRSIGGEAEVHVEVYPPRTLQAGDKILLCSDGLTRYSMREDIAMMTTDGSPQEIVDRLIKFANQRGGADNISAILISYGAVEILEPTVHIQRPLLPPSIEDMLDTIPDIKPQRRQATIRTIGATVFIVILVIAVTLMAPELQAPAQLLRLSTHTPITTIALAPPASIPTALTLPLISSSTPDTPIPPIAPTLQTLFVIQCPDGVNVRESASKDSAEVGKLAKGDSVYITGNATNGKVDDNGNTGIWLEIIYSPASNERRWIVQKTVDVVCVDAKPENLTFLTVTPFINPTFTEGTPPQ